MPGVPGPVTKPCDARLTPRAAVRHADVVALCVQADVELVDGVRSERLGAAERPELRAADRQRVEARDVRAALLARIRIVERVVVEEVVARSAGRTAACCRRGGTTPCRRARSARTRRSRTCSAPAFGVGMYCSSCCAGADHARCGIDRVREHALRRRRACRRCSTARPAVTL